MNDAQRTLLYAGVMLIGVVTLGVTINALDNGAVGGLLPTEVELVCLDAEGRRQDIRDGCARLLAVTPGRADAWGSPAEPTP